VLDSGRLLQCGATQAVFDRPADLRTARLLGVDNLWPLQVLAAVRTQQPPAIVLGHDACPVLDWTQPLPANVALRPGDRVVVMVRAEHVQPLPAASRPAADGMLALPAKLTAARLEGPLWRLHCELACGLNAQAYALPAQWRELALALGAPLTLGLRRQDLHLLV
jgi:iron(III) transport system ATP-binding protein